MTTTNDTAAGKAKASRAREKGIIGYATTDYVAAWLVDHGDSEDPNYGLSQFIRTGDLEEGQFETIARKAVGHLERLLPSGRLSRQQGNLLSSLSMHLYRSRH